MKKILKNKKILVGIIMVTFVIIIAIISIFYTPNDPYLVNLSVKFSNPNQKFLLGTDQLGRCVLSRLMVATTYSVFLSFSILVILIVISLIIGITSIYFGGIYNSIISIICDIFMIFPPFALALVLNNILGIGIKNFVIAIVSSMWVWFVKIIRTYVQVELKKEYIVASKIAGCTNIKLIFYHILPNIFPSLLVYFSTNIASIILIISAFSFLGMGFSTSIPEWGGMLTQGKAYFYSSPGLIIFPGLCILFTTTGFNLLSEGLKEYLES